MRGPDESFWIEMASYNAILFFLHHHIYACDNYHLVCNIANHVLIMSIVVCVHSTH